MKPETSYKVINKLRKGRKTRYPATATAVVPA